MTEQMMRHRVVNAMLKGLGAFAVENPACPGTPDVCTTVGWLELKVARWPRKVGSVVNVDLRQTQRLWIRRWARHDGNVWTLTWISNEWFLHDGRWSADHLGNVDERVFRNCALYSWDQPHPTNLDAILVSHSE